MTSLDYKEIEQLVRTRAFEIANVKDLVIKFSNLMRGSYALCYWQETPQAIHFNKRFIDANIDNYIILNELIIHECIHLIPGYNRHNKKFFTKCRVYGIEPYGFSTTYNGLKPIFKTYCTNCKDCKNYYAKPKKMICRLCKGALKVVDVRDIHEKEIRD